jgi:hypothetical protein
VAVADLQVAPTEPPAYSAPEYGSYDDVLTHVATWDEALKARVNPVLSFLQRDLEVKRQDMDEAKNRYNNIITRLEEGGAADAKTLSSMNEEQHAIIDALAAETTTMAWDAFKVVHPEQDRMPEPMRNEFAQACSNMHALFGDKPNLLGMIEAAYEYAAWKTKTDLDGLRNPQSNVTPIAQARAERMNKPIMPPAQPTREAQRQALVAETGLAYTQPRRSIDEQPLQEILDRHEKYLDM